MNCIICNIDCKSQRSLLIHVKNKHNLTPQNYYDKLYNKSFCLTCGKETSFIGFKYGYKQYCSAKCAANNNETKEKRKSTNLAKYGCVNVSQNENIKKKKVDTYLLHIEETKEKVKQTNQTKYGCDWYTQSKEFQTKYKETCLNKYGVDNYAKSNNWHKSFIQSHKQNIELYKTLHYIPIKELFIKYGTGWYQANIVPIKLYKHTAYINENDIEQIQQYSTRSNSKLENIIVDYIKQIYNKQIIRNTRKIIAPYELDIYLPDIKLGIEINGTWYHSIENGCTETYHLEKALLCKEQNVRLLHIYEFDMNNMNYVQDLINKAISGYNIIHTKSIKIKDRYTVYITDQLLKEVN